jgi:hypothetical protein
VSLHRRRRDPERFRRLLHAEPTEGAQLHDARLLLVERGQLQEGLVQGEQIEPARGDRGERIVEGGSRSGATALPRLLPAAVVHEDAPHHGCGDGQEVRAVLPDHAVLLEQAEVGLVDEGGGLQSVAAALAAQVTGGAAAQVVVDERHQPLVGLAVALTPENEEFGDAFGRCGHGEGLRVGPAERDAQGYRRTGPGTRVRSSASRLSP